MRANAAMVAIAFVLVGCGTDEAVRCTLGQVVACPCAGGGPGAQTCGASGSFGACVCAGADGGTDGGTSRADGGGVPATGSAAWRVRCPASSSGANCNVTSHSVRGSAGSPTVDVVCNVAPTTGGTRITFRIAAIEPGQNFSESQEGLFATGVLERAGAELRSGGEGGFVQVRGAGWGVKPADGTIGVTGVCHVFIDAVDGQNFRGRMRCEGLQDNLSPPRSREVIGLIPQTTTNEYAEFSFANCDRR